LNSAVSYGYLAARGWLTFPDSLPLELCDATLCLTVISAFKLDATAFDLAHYGALAGTSMAVLTPDLWEPFPSFSTVQFFVAHGLVLVAVLYLVWSRAGAVGLLGHRHVFEVTMMERRGYLFGTLGRALADPAYSELDRRWSKTKGILVPTKHEPQKPAFVETAF
jgi:hypothetical protein